MYLGMGGSFGMGRNLRWGLPTRTNVQCWGINREVKVFRNRRQFELKIERHIIPDLGAFESLEAIPDTQQLVLPLPQTDFENFARHVGGFYRRNLTDDRDQLGAVRR